MSIDPVELLGFVAGACSTLAFVPQVLRVWKTRSARDISYGMYFIFLSGNVLWFAYGVSTHAIPLIVCNVVTILLSAAVVVMKVRLERAGRL